MNGYEHDLGRSETNLDVFYPILNLFLALEVRNHPNPKYIIACWFRYTRILRALKLNRTRKAPTMDDYILVLKGKSRNIARMTINHNENIFRIGKLTTDILITFTFRAILTKLELLGKNRSKIWLQNAPKSMFLELKTMLLGAF